MASNVSEIRDEDELEVYGNERQSSVIKITSFVFEVSLFNCTDANANVIEDNSVTSL